MNFWPTGRLEIVWLAVAGMAYVYYFVLKFRKGAPRLIALLPLLPFYVVVPWRAATPNERSLWSFFFLWMGAFKLIMLAFDEGPAKDPSVVSSFPRFFSAMSLPMHFYSDPPRTPSSRKDSYGDCNANGELQGESRSRSDDGDGVVKRRRRSGARDGRGVEVMERDTSERSSSLLNVIATSLSWKIVVLRCVIYFISISFWIRLCMMHDTLPVIAIYLGYSVLIYLGALFIFELPAALSVSILGVEMPPQFNKPFLADSLVDFWSRRWNLLVNNLLRASIYNPMVKYLSGSGGNKVGGRARALATMASFVVSGIMHEIIFFYMNQSRPTFEVTMFFVLNGAATVWESFLKRRSICPPRIVRRVYTLSFVFLTACWLFYPPIVRTGIDKKSLEDLEEFRIWVQQNLSLSWT